MNKPDVRNGGRGRFAMQCDNVDRVSPALTRHNRSHMVYLMENTEQSNDRANFSTCHRRIKQQARTFCVQAIHHTANELQFILYAEVDEVRINKHTIRRCKSSIVLKEERRRHLRASRKVNNIAA